MQKIRLEPEEIRDFYNHRDVIWNGNDPWHIYTYKRISNFIRNICEKYSINGEDIKILNAGSAGNEYEIKCNHYHVDIAEDKLKYVPNSYVASIEKLPFPNGFFDTCFCVGSVINYCEAVKAICEIDRVIKPGGSLILEFENSFSFEYLFNRAFGRCSHLVKTHYNNQQHQLWVYSEQHIINLLEAFGFDVQENECFHILSPMIYKVTKRPNLASKFSWMDRYLHSSFIKRYSSNIILYCVKST